MGLFDPEGLNFIVSLRILNDRRRIGVLFPSITIGTFAASRSMSMSEHRDRTTCQDCHSVVSRRDFVRALGVGTASLAASGWGPLAIPSRGQEVIAGPGPDAVAETAVKRLYDSLSNEQRQAICLPFDDPKRFRINANWSVTELSIGDDFTSAQQELIREIFRGVTSPDGYERFLRQMDEDAGGFEAYNIAIFGEPGSDRFEWEMTGRHLTIRADGNSVEGAAFGGPIVYGHGEGDGLKGLPGNVFYYQTQKANEVFQALDGAQRERALVARAPRETAVKIQGASGTFPGIAVTDLSKDQQELVRSVIGVVLAPYREQDVEEALAIMEQGGGLETLRMAFYESGDLGNDQEWDIWRLEGPTFVSHFRGSPHVHAYLNVASKPNV